MSKGIGRVTVGKYRELVESRFPGFRVRTIRPLLGGWDSDVIEVNSEFVFKFPRREPVHEMIRKEIRLLPELGRRLSVPVPVPEFADLATPFLGYRMIPGAPLSRMDLRDGSLASQLADAITQIHSFPVDDAVGLRVPERDWRGDFESFYQWVREHALHLLDGCTRERAIQVWESYLDMEPEYAPVLVHCDLSGDAHILCDPDSNRVIGIIDWGDARIGDPAIDFTGIYWDCGGEFARAVLDSYGGKKDCGLWERMLFHYRIGPFHEIRYGREIGDKGRVRKGVKALATSLGRTG